MNKQIRFISIALLVLLSIWFTPDPAHDLFRYYEDGQEMAGYSLRELVVERNEAAFDFVYYVTLWLFVQLGLPLRLVTGLFVFLYYRGASHIFEDYCAEEAVTAKAQRLGYLMLFFSLPFLFVFSIARTTASLGFLFYCIHFFHKKRYFKTLIFAVLSVLTHVGIAPYAGLVFVFIALTWVFREWDFRYLLGAEIGGLLLLMLSLSTIITSVLSLSFFTSYAYFGKYLTDFQFGMVGGNGRTADIATIMYMGFALLLSLLSLTKERSNYNYIYSLCLICAATSFLSIMFFQRACMLLVPFVGIFTTKSCKRGHVKFCSLIVPISIFMFFAVLLAFHYCFI